MKITLSTHDSVGFLHPAIDIHTLGISTAAQLLEDCGIRTVVAGHDLCQAIESLDPRAHQRLVEWVESSSLTALGYSYRLDPGDGLRFFGVFASVLHANRLLAGQGGPLRAIYFAGLPETCRRVASEFPWVEAVFIGDETARETLTRLGLPPAMIPASLTRGVAYDEARWDFASRLIQSGQYKTQAPLAWAYPNFGTEDDRLVDRIAEARRLGFPPLMRAHVGAYLPHRQQAVKQNLDWARTLAASGLLDVLSVGSSQLTQSDFFRTWGTQPNGGGVPLRTENEFAELWQAARPMLVRAYSGTRDIVQVAEMLERNIHIAWHALSLWWFCQIDGRGPNTVRDNLSEHWETMRFIAASGKPFEPNLPHHFAFRGGDDVSYVVSGYLAARLAKKAGIQDFVLQVMLNTPKSTWGIQDLAKARALLRLVRSLEGPSFRVHLQPRGGLDYFSPDTEKAKIQLASVSALMEDIEPDDPHSPAVIHVVSYSEASRLADPAVVNESVQITRQALADWRAFRKENPTQHAAFLEGAAERTQHLGDEADAMLRSIERNITDPISPQGLYQVLRSGYFPVPYLWECREEFQRATAWETRWHDGGVRVMEHGKPLSMANRLAGIEAWMKESTHD